MAVALPTESAMPNHLLDHPTLDPGADSTALDDAGIARRAALTIVWHPDLERIGQSAVLPDGESEVSRALPLFGDRTETASGAPLADLYLSSREPSVTIRQVRDGIEVTPAAGVGSRQGGRSAPLGAADVVARGRRPRRDHHPRAPGGAVPAPRAPGPNQDPFIARAGRCQRRPGRRPPRHRSGGRSRRRTLDSRRDRDRKGHGCRQRCVGQPPCGSAVRVPEHGSHRALHGRVRAVRTRARFVHWCDRVEGGPLRRCRQWHIVSRRGRADATRRSKDVASCPRDEGGPPARGGARPEDRRPVHRCDGHGHRAARSAEAHSRRRSCNA